MNKKVITAIALICVTGMVILFYCRDNINQVSLSVHSAECSVNIRETAEYQDNQEKTDTEEVSDGNCYTKEELLEVYSEKLADKLNDVRQYFSLNAQDRSVEEFVFWLTEQYGIDVIKELSVCEPGSMNIQLYMQTGKSMIVLCDEFLGNQDSICKNGRFHNRAEILFAGDVCLAEDGFVLDYYDTVNGLKDCISEKIIQKTNEADIFMLNNEFCFSNRGNPLNGKLYTFRARPDRVSLLQELGTDIVSLANNHVYDYGKEAFEDTLKTLNETGIQYVGGGNSASEAEKVVYYVVNGIKIGIVSASRAEKVRYTPGAKESSAGIFLMYDDERLLQVIEEADKQCDYLIAYVHWGTEDSRYYEEYQHNIAVELIDSGVDVIIGGHPHVLQGFEYINGKPVIYSLGDFWFNSETKYNGMVSLSIGINGLIRAEYIPCIQANYTTVYVEEENQRNEIFTYINELSDGCQVNNSGEIVEEK